jgi:predicted histone-like DNA-binding protein
MITLHTIQRKNPKDATKLSYYPSISKQTPVKRDAFFDEITHESTLTKHDVKAAVSALEAQVIKYLEEGYSVRLGDLGSFHLTCKGKGEATEDKVTTKDILRLRVQFTPSAVMEAAFKVKDNSDVKFLMAKTV